LTVIHAYIDESVKPMREFRTLRPRVERHYVIAAITLFEADSANLRERLRSLRDEIEVPIHYSEMNKDNRLNALTSVSAFRDWEGFLFETKDPNTRSERQVRDKLLRVALLDLVHRHGVSRVTIESRNISFAGAFDKVYDGLDRYDVAVLTSLRSKHMLEKELELVHATKDEEILWLADLLASSRSDALCHPKKGEYFSYIAHRVREIRKVRV